VNITVVLLSNMKLYNMVS